MGPGALAATLALEGEEEGEDEEGTAESEAAKEEEAEAADEAEVVAEVVAAEREAAAAGEEAAAAGEEAAAVGEEAARVDARNAAAATGMSTLNCSARALSQRIAAVALTSLLRCLSGQTVARRPALRSASYVN